jgi:hypothetical protein
MEPSATGRVEDVRTGVAEVCAALGARAAGYWELDLENGRLIQLAFVPGAGLAPDVGREFAAATLIVPMTQKNLGIVTAALTGMPAISRADELPPDSGSGRWLRAFDASRSVAVPILDAKGSVRGVISVALPADNEALDQAIVEQLESSRS